MGVFSPGYVTTGIVVSVESSKELKVRVPEIHGADPLIFGQLDTSKFTQDENLPVAKVQSSSQVSYSVGDIVYVTFPAGNAQTPLVTGLVAQFGGGGSGSGSSSDEDSSGTGSSTATYDKETGESIENEDPVTPAKVNTYISSAYGPRGSKTHMGIDIGVFSGTPIYAILDGLVVKKKVDQETYWWGGHVIISHGKFNGKEIFSGYAHIKKFGDFAVNQEIKKGDLIGYSGGSSSDPHHGSSTGPHLHFEIYVGSTSSSSRVNPASYLKYFNGGADNTRLNWKE